MSNQKQKGGLGSTNTQIVEQHIHNGLTPQDAMDMTLKLFHDNFPILQNQAFEMVNERMDNFMSELFEKLAERNFQNYAKFSDPALQYTLYEAQKEYAKTGDENIKYNLLTILLERINIDSRDENQIILDQAINELPRLTQKHLDLLSTLYIIFLYNFTFEDLDEFKLFIVDTLSKFINYSEECMEQCAEYLRITNCVSYLPTGSHYLSLEEIFFNNYQVLFSKGFSINEFESAIGETYTDFQPVLINYFHDNTKFQFNAMNKSVLEHQIQTHNLDVYKNKLISLYKNTSMNADDVREYLKSIDSNFATLINIWNKEFSFLTSIAITGIGEILAVINYNLKTGKNIPLPLVNYN